MPNSVEVFHWGRNVIKLWTGFKNFSNKYNYERIVIKERIKKINRNKENTIIHINHITVLYTKVQNCIYKKERSGILIVIWLKAPNFNQHSYSCTQDAIAYDGLRNIPQEAQSRISMVNSFKIKINCTALNTMLFLIWLIYEKRPRVYI